MPLYHYLCEVCHHRDDEFQHIRDEPLRECPKCKEAAYKRQIVPVGTGNALFQKPIEMHSIAFTDHESIRDFKRRMPDVVMSDDPRDPLYGVPLARSREEKLRILKAEGYQEKT